MIQRISEEFYDKDDIWMTDEFIQESAISRPTEEEVEEIINETYGTITLPDENNVVSFVEKICNDVRTKKYLRNKIPNQKILYSKIFQDVLNSNISNEKVLAVLIGEPDSTLNYYQFIQDSGKELYLIHYPSTGIEWLKCLDVVVNPVPIPNRGVNAVAYPNKPQLSYFNHNKIIKATISINIPNSPMLEDDVYHEIKHYYDEFKMMQSKNTFDKESNSNRIVELSFDTKVFYTLSKSKYFRIWTFDDEQIKNLDTLKGSRIDILNIVVSLLYWSSYVEMSPHLENIRSEINRFFKQNKNNKSNSIYNISRTYHAYKNMLTVIDFILNDVDIKFKQEIYKEPKEFIYKNILSTSQFKINRYNSINSLMYKSKQNIEKMLKQAHKFYAYYSNDKSENFLP